VHAPNCFSIRATRDVNLRALARPPESPSHVRSTAPRASTVRWYGICSCLHVCPDRVRFRVADRCIGCGALNSVRLESTVTGNTVALAWYCHACGYQWPTRSAERATIDRRGGAADRRRTTRSDRRMKKGPKV